MSKKPSKDDRMTQAELLGWLKCFWDEYCFGFERVAKREPGKHAQNRQAYTQLKEIVEEWFELKAYLPKADSDE